MIPKKIYINDKAWSEAAVSVTICDMQNREYIDLSQVWHEAKEKPRIKEWILVQFSGGDYEALALDELGLETWSVWWCDNYKVIRWAYINDLLPIKERKK